MADVVELLDVLEAFEEGTVAEVQTAAPQGAGDRQDGSQPIDRRVVIAVPEDPRVVRVADAEEDLGLEENRLSVAGIRSEADDEDTQGEGAEPKASSGDRSATGRRPGYGTGSSPTIHAALAQFVAGGQGTEV